MNKSERQKLASIVSEMTTSFESTMEVVTFGSKLLKEFPCIAKLVEQYDGVQRIENIASSYTSYLVKMSSSYSLTTKVDINISELGSSGRESLYYVFDEYFCHKNTIDAEELEDKLGGYFKTARECIRELLEDTTLMKLISESDELCDEQKSLFKGEKLGRDR